MQDALSLITDNLHEVIFECKDTERTTSNRSNLKIDLFDKSLTGNNEQLQAIRNIMDGTAHPYPFILFGPPGTGKTVTIVESIKQLWSKDKVSISSTFYEQFFRFKSVMHCY